MNRIGRIIMRQLFFDLLINCYPIFILSTVQQFLSLNPSSIINFPTLITIGLMAIFLITMLLYCKMVNNGFGENQLKFKENKVVKYWAVVVAERVVLTAVVGLKVPYYVYVLIGMKVVVFGYFAYSKFFNSKIQNYRSLLIQLLHILLLSTYALNQYYLQPTKLTTKLPPSLISYIYVSILSVILIITIIFYIR